jgi:GT2 family glycosyltransferase
MQPDFSIIVPTYNRPKQLAACLGALARLDYPRDRLEVVVVDDGSAVPLDVAFAACHDGFEIKRYRQENAGPGPARNTGARLAKGRILVFTDDDCAPHADWLSTLAARFAEVSDPVIIGGRVLNALPNNPFAAASQLTVDVGYAFHNSDPNNARLFTTSNLAMPADRFHEIGGFDETFGTTASEDRELCGRWQHRGYRMIYAPESRVDHAHALTGRTFIRQHFNYGRGAARLQQARARQGWQVFSPDPHYYRLLLGAPFTNFPLHKAMGVAALLVTSQMVAALGMAWEWPRQRREQRISAENV